jgi:protein-disulfide isomerase
MLGRPSATSWKGPPALGRRTLLLGAGAALLASEARASAEITADDIVLGAADASVTLIEYASTTCPHCAAFHARVWEALHARYIAAARLRFVFREMPTPPAAVAVACFQIARCRGATADQYVARVGELFRQQPVFLAETTMEGVRRRLIEIGQGFGLTSAEVNAAITDPEGGARARRIGEGASAFNITRTPSFVINGAPYSGPLSGRDLFAALDAAGS